MAAKVLATCIVKSYLMSGPKQLLTYCLKTRFKLQTAGYAVKKVAGASVKKKPLEVETDAEILCSRLCGGNIFKEGEDPVLGPDSDYPDWLWDLHIDKKAISLEDLSEDDPRYWRKLKTMTIRQNNKLKSVQKF